MKAAMIFDKLSYQFIQWWWCVWGGGGEATVDVCSTAKATDALKLFTECSKKGLPNTRAEERSNHG